MLRVNSATATSVIFNEGYHDHTQTIFLPLADALKMQLDLINAIDDCLAKKEREHKRGELGSPEQNDEYEHYSTTQEDQENERA